jgi:hypothetical protein
MDSPEPNSNDDAVDPSLGQAPNPFAAPHEPAHTDDLPLPPIGPFQFGISSLLLVTTLLAVICSITVMVPGLGIVLAILAVPALVRTCVVASRRAARGEPTPVGKKTSIFLLTMAVIVTVIVAVGGAFFFTCMTTFVIGSAAGRNSDTVAVAAILGVALGSVAAIVVSIFIARVIRKNSRSNRADGNISQPCNDGDMAWARNRSGRPIE